MVFTIVSVESNCFPVFLKVRKRKTAVRRRPARNVDIPNTSDIFGIDPTTYYCILGDNVRGKSFTDKVQLGSDVLCYRSFGVKPEDWEEDIRKFTESSNVCVRFELNDDLQSHQDFCRY